MASGKKRRKQKKRRKIKMENVPTNKTNHVNKVAVNCSVTEDHLDIFTPSFKNFKHNRIAKYKGSLFVPPSCITSYCSTPHKTTNIIKLKKKYQPQPIIETTHIFNTEPSKKTRRTKSLGACAVIVPPSCLQLNFKSNYKNNYTYAKPINLEKAANIIMPLHHFRNKKRRGACAPFVPLSCITTSNSSVWGAQPKQQKKFSYPPPTEHKLSPPIIFPELRYKHRNKRYGNNNVIVPESCIIKPKVISQASAYDWRKAFPKPICLEQAADIIGPTIKIRANKRRYTDSGFVPNSCIIVPKEVISPTKQARDEENVSESEAAALAQQAPTTTDSSNNLYLLAVVVIVAFAAFVYMFSN